MRLDSESLRPPPEHLTLGAAHTPLLVHRIDAEPEPDVQLPVHCVPTLRLLQALDHVTPDVRGGMLTHTADSNTNRAEHICCMGR